MRNLNLLLFFFLMPVSSMASSYSATYIVPTSPELVEYSRFKVEILKPYKGKKTKKISYIFPEILVGEKDRVVEFTRVPNTTNQWESKEMQARCTTLDEEFSCDIFLKKQEEPKFSGIADPISLQAMAERNPLSLKKSLTHLAALNIPGADKDNFINVIEDFFSNEPAGFLTYRYLVD